MKDFLRSVLLWGEKEIRLGKVNLFFCDTSVSVNLMDGDYLSYGITIEPFQAHLIGADGDIAASYGWNLTNAILKRI